MRKNYRKSIAGMTAAVLALTAIGTFVSPRMDVLADTSEVQSTEAEPAAGEMGTQDAGTQERETRERETQDAGTQERETQESETREHETRESAGECEQELPSETEAEEAADEEMEADGQSANGEPNEEALAALMRQMVSTFSLEDDIAAMADTPTAIAGTGLEYLFDSDSGILTIEQVPGAAGTGGLSIPNYTIANPAPWSAFADDITEIKVSDAVSVGNYAFYGMTNLIVARLPGTLESIGSSAFENCPELWSVDVGEFGDMETEGAIADSLSVGPSAFSGCAALYIVDFYNKEVSIGTSAFKDCSALSAVDMYYSDSLQIGAKAFESCKELEELWLRAPEGASIAASAFEGCDKEAIFVRTTPDSDEVLTYAAANGMALGFMSVDAGAVEDRYMFAYMKLEGGKLTVTTPSLDYPAVIQDYTASSKPVWVTNTVLKNAITEIEIDGSVWEVGEYAFAGMDQVETIELSMNNGASIGAHAFENMTAVTALNFGDPSYSDPIEIGAYAFAGMSALTELDLSTRYYEPIGDHAFSGMTSVESLKLPGRTLYDGSKNTIGDYAFSGMKSLEELPEFPYGWNEIGTGWFAGCTGLVGVNLVDRDGAPLDITSIGDSAFKGCRNLTIAGIPATVTTIALDAFENCSKDLAFFLVGNEEFSAYPAFNYALENQIQVCFYGMEDFMADAYLACENTSAPYNATLTVQTWDKIGSVDDSAIDDYRWNSDDLRNIVTKLVIEKDPESDEAVTIGRNAFAGFENLTEVTLSDDVTAIGANAFADCTGLTEITLSDSITLGNRVFAGCDNLVVKMTDQDTDTIAHFAGNPDESGTIDRIQVAISNTNLNWEYPFNNTYSITGTGMIPARSAGADPVWVTYTTGAYHAAIERITIGNGVTGIGANAFENVDNISGVAFEGTSVSTVDNFAFKDCDGLTTIELPSSVANFGFGVFANCTGLETASLPGSVTYVNGDTFSGCTALTDVTLPSGIKYVSGRAFRGCTSLASVTVPDSCIGFGASAFEGCSNLRSINIPDGVTAISKRAFAGTNLSGISFPSSLKKVAGDAFEGCSVSIPSDVTVQ